MRVLQARLQAAASADVAELLLAHGAAVNVVNQYGAAPLYSAAMRGHRDVADVLLAAKFRVTHREAVMQGGLRPGSTLQEIARLGYFFVFGVLKALAPIVLHSLRTKPRQGEAGASWPGHHCPFCGS